jgi:tetraacyldisaccharide 4'-kinase
MLTADTQPSRRATTLLYAPGMAYRAVVRLRNALYDAGYLKARHLPCSVISIGNLTVGGTGKTPVTAYLAGMLSESGYRVAVLSRGYRRRSGKRPLLVADGHALLADAEEAGDEPYLIARLNPAVAVAVGADRVRASRLVCAVSSPEVILLDDAFQHRPVHRDLNLLLVDGRHPWGNGKMIPLGPLREPPSAVSRADALIVTRGDGRCPDDLRTVLARHHPRLDLFHLRLQPDGYVRADGEEVGPAALKGFSVFAFSGIARPDRFEDDLRSLGVRLAGARRYPDHHHYRRRDLEDIVRLARDAGAEALVTTEKDLTRGIGVDDRALPCYALRLRIDPVGGSALSAFVLEKLRCLAARPRDGGTR